MHHQHLHAFKNKRVLLLQGPVGPFFRRFAADIEHMGATVYKVNFNAGDAFFYPNGYVFKQPLPHLGEYLLKLVEANPIDTLVMFGDCRPIHMIAKETLNNHDIQIFVFEEGYLRPNHITLESHGVNGYSRLSKDIEDYLVTHHEQDIAVPNIVEVGKTYWYAAWWAVLYYVAAHLGRYRFPHYTHHRPLTMLEGLYWIRGTWRKWLFKFRERGLERKINEELRQQYFLVPLQLYNDFQISHHSNFKSIDAFIDMIMRSFATHAPKDTYLVLKQHPFDRGYSDYTEMIRQLGAQLNIADRVFYIHDQYLPTLLKNARGVVVINSTVGLSAIEQFRPVKVCGEAIYNIEHLSVQASLDEFWQIAETFKPDPIYVHQYLNYLSQHTQHNGSFYRKIPDCDQKTGVLWSQTD